MGLPDAEDNIFGLWLEQGPDKTNCNFIIILVKIYMGKMVRYIKNKLQNFMNECIQGVVLVTHAVCSIIKPWHPWTRGIHFNGNSSRGKLSCKTVPWNKGPWVAGWGATNSTLQGCMVKTKSTCILKILHNYSQHLFDSN